MTVLKWVATIILVVVLALCVIWGMAALADDQSYLHARGHDEYKSWTSLRMPGGCCSNQDCAPLDKERWRETETGTEIEIEGQWCPVKREHFLTKGKSPDWTTAHACIRQRFPGSNVTACERLLCFVGTPGG